MEHDLDYYNRRLHVLNNQIIERQINNRAIENDIAALRLAYNRLKKIQDDYARPLENDAKLERCAGELRWRGNTKNKFDGCVNNDVREGAKAFLRSINRMMDEINWEIDRRQRMLSSGFSLLDSLRNAYSAVRTTIENWTN